MFKKFEVKLCILSKRIGNAWNNYFKTVVGRILPILNFILWYYICGYATAQESVQECINYMGVLCQIHI